MRSLRLTGPSPTIRWKVSQRPLLPCGDLADFLLAGLTYIIGWRGNRVGAALRYARPQTQEAAMTKRRGLWVDPRPMPPWNCRKQ